MSSFDQARRQQGRPHSDSGEVDVLANYILEVGFLRSVIAGIVVQAFVCVRNWSLRPLQPLDVQVWTFGIVVLDGDSFMKVGLDHSLLGIQRCFMLELPT